MTDNSVGKGFGATLGVVLALSLLGMIPICGCGGCLLVGFVAAPLNQPSAENRHSEKPNGRSRAASNPKFWVRSAIQDVVIKTLAERSARVSSCAGARGQSDPSNPKFWVTFFRQTLQQPHPTSGFRALATGVYVRGV